MSQEGQSKKTNFQITDRRFWVSDESIMDRAAAPKDRYPSFVEELKARTEAAEQKLREKLNLLEEENQAYRERLNRQVEKRLTEEKATFFSEFLEVVDNLERAIESGRESKSFEAFHEGVSLNLTLLLNKLELAGVEAIENLHEIFDPAEAEAISVVSVEDSDLDNRIVEIVKKGYRFGDRLLRPSLVKVGQFSSET